MKINIEAKRPLIISDKVYIVDQGSIDVFAVENEGKGRRHYLFSVEVGEIVVGSKNLNGNVMLLSGLYGSSISEISEEDAKDKVLEYIGKISKKFVATGKVNNVSGKTIIKKGEYFSASNPIAIVIKGEASILGMHTPNKFILANVPILAHSELEIEETKLNPMESIDMYMACYSLAIAEQEKYNLEKYRAKVSQNESFIQKGISKLLNVIKASNRTFTGDPHLIVAKMIGEDLDMPIVEPKFKSKSYSIDPLSEIARVSKFMVRAVKLEDNWWQQDSGPIYCFIKGEPVAVIAKKGKYYACFPSGEKKKITSELAKTFDIDAFIIYKPFPNKVLTLWDIFKFSMRPNTLKDFVTISIIGGLMSILGSFIPIVTASIFDSVIPSAEYGSLAYITFFLVIISIVSALFSIARSIASQRFEGRVDYMMQSAIWSRLLALPVPFFDKYSASDLSGRANTISAIRRMLTGAAMSSILDAAFSFVPFAVLFTFSLELALIAVVLTLIPVLITFIVGKIRLSLITKSIEINSKAESTIMQIINGISKFKMIGGENIAYSLWADKYYNEHKIQSKANTIGDFNSMFNGFYPILTSVIVFYFVSKSDITIGQYMGFHSAFTMFMSSLLGLSSTAVSLLKIYPLYDRAKPILETIPEVTEQKKDPGKLAGHIKVENISYSYKDKKVLENVSFEAKPGEFIAFVGSSGSGKSTLVRLLLGFDKPLDGTIYYDDYNINDADIQSIRRELGVVLQKGELMPGDIFTNVIGPYNLTIDDAWESLKAAGFYDDVKSMPMGLHTVVGSGTLSGGQKQRVLIARALVNKPKIIIFDGATSALDNKTQSLVLDSLSKLSATKIVISHRLSTIINADKIYVLDEGKIIESGKYNELMEKNGVFAEFARRQIA